MTKLEQALKAAAQAAQRLAKRRAALEDAQHAVECAEEDAEGAALAAKVLGAAELVGRCFRWDENIVGSDDVSLQKIISVDVVADKLVMVQVSDKPQPGPFAPKIQLYGTNVWRVFEYMENQHEISAEEFERHYRSVASKLAAAAGILL